MSRNALIALRRELIEKITTALPNSKLFKNGLMYPRRYFDDLIFEQRVQNHQIISEYENSETATSNRLKEAL
jgi:hypothetical protein